MSKAPKSLKSIDINDIFDKNPRTLTRANLKRLVSFYRNLRVQWYADAEAKEAKAAAKEAKKNKKSKKNAEEILDMKLSDIP